MVAVICRQGSSSKKMDAKPGLAERNNQFMISGRWQLMNSVVFHEQTTSNINSDEALKDLDVMIISRDRSLISQICRHLDAWKRSYTVCADSAQAISHLTQICNSTEEPTSCSLIIDSRSLDLDPAHFPLLIQHEAKLAKLKLLYIHNKSGDKVENDLVSQGYHNIISLHDVIPQLFSLFQDDPAPTDADNVISFAGNLDEQHMIEVSKAILLAEQNSSDREQLQLTLRNAGHKVISVADGDQALEALEHQSFDLAIINLDLPIMNGTQVVRLHRFTTAYNQQVPFIVITNNHTTNALRICQDLHISACLFKPVPSSELLDRIDTCLSSNDILNKRTSELETPSEKVDDTQLIKSDILD
jgi:CheY-like chemotaxis protein